MFTVPTPAAFVQPVDASPTFSRVGLPDDVTASLSRAAALDAAYQCDQADEQAEWDATHCTCCGAESAGITFVGIRVPMCDHCVIAELVGKVGAYHVRDVVAVVAPAFGA